ncbi:hypothetical protein GU926_07260 [Nibribacter ruber]|uniref:Uncharacterized protein n=1 Tax=Nibribacter ruber TaxID=2698458 RepID=A0A6P1NW01_9BACT|nr:hypothetical protein [Nibribacter ruber]QHL87240.1 hypothetical protein GU926_07260 [Nibribacter ruber]
MVDLLLSLSGVLLYFSYPMVIGYLLQGFLSPKVQLRSTYFLVNCFVWFGVYVITMVLSEGKSVHYSGLKALPGFYVFFAFLYSTNIFPAKTIKSIELSKEARFGDYFFYSFLILFLPFGIWILQPRINRIAAGQLTEPASFN